MTCHFRSFVVCFIFLTLQLATSMAQSKPAQVPMAPIPAQVLSAKRVFIANAGGDEMAPDDPIFTGGPDRAYDQFYSAVTNWGRFKVVDSPGQADLVLEIRQETQTIEFERNGSRSAVPLFQLKIIDPKTHLLLWAFHVHGEFGLGQANSDRNFDQAVNRLVIRLQALIAPATPDKP